MWSFFFRSNVKREKVSSSEIISKAIIDNDLSKVQEYIKAENINSKCAQGMRPLDLAVQHGSLEVIKYLLDHGANYNILTKNGDPLLLSAVRNGEIEVVKLLLQYEKIAETINLYSMVKGDTALSCAFIAGDEKMINLLAANGADILKAYKSAHDELVGRIKTLNHLKNIVEKQMDDSLLGMKRDHTSGDEMNRDHTLDDSVIDLTGSDEHQNTLEAA